MKALCVVRPARRLVRPRPSAERRAREPAAFDASRSMSSNPDPLGSAIFAFVGPRIEQVRKASVESQREQRATEQAQRLQGEASRIEEIINQDFESSRKRLPR